MWRVLAIVVTALLVVPFPGTEPGLQSAAKLLVLAAAAVALARHAEILRDHVSCLLLAFAASGFVSALAGGESLATCAPIVVTLGCLWLMAATFGGTDERIELAITIACAGIVAFACLELLGASLPWSWNRRPESTLGNRNHVAEYLVIALPFLVRRARGLMRMRALVLAAIAVIVATHCRTAYLAAILGCLVAFGYRRRVPRWLLGTAVAGIVLGSLPWPGVQFRTSTGDAFVRIIDPRGSGDARVAQHRRGLAAIAYPRAAVLGVGPGGWMRASAAHAHASGDHTPRMSGAIAPNSEWLRTLVEQGALGVAILLGLAVAAARAAHRDPDRARRAVRVASLAMVAVVGTFDPLVIRPELVPLLAAVLASPAPSRSRAPRARRSVVVATVAAFAITGLRCASFVASTWGSPSCAGRLWPRPALDERRALQQARAGDCRAAERALARFVAARPYVWGARLAVARCYARTGRGNDARRVMRAALAHEPHLRALAHPDD